MQTELKVLGTEFTSPIIIDQHLSIDCKDAQELVVLIRALSLRTSHCTRETSGTQPAQKIRGLDRSHFRRAKEDSKFTEYVYILNVLRILLSHWPRVRRLGIQRSLSDQFR